MWYITPYVIFILDGNSENDVYVLRKNIYYFEN